MMLNNLPESLQKLLRDIIVVSGNDDGDIITEKTFEVLRYDSLLAYASVNHPPSESYGRKIIYKDETVEVLFISWCPGDFTAIHNHAGMEWGYVYTFGDLTHRVYDLDDGLMHLDLSATLRPGQLTKVSSELIHLMGNTSNRALYSIHIYFKSNSSLQSSNTLVYQPERSKVLESKGPAFLNLNLQTGQTEKDFNLYTDSALMDYYLLTRKFFERINRMDASKSILSKILKYA
jgi:predicted metal-dependent enzyme (double-stranded beta helix superfamily)